MRRELSGGTLRRLRRLPAGARAELVRVLASSSDVRADVIRQFHERGHDAMVDVLTDLEADELLRLQVIEVLKQVQDRQ